MSEAGDGAAFKGATYQKALTHISHLCEHGVPKDVKSLWFPKCAQEPVTPTHPAAKRVRGVKNATALELENLSSSFSVFGTTIVNALNGPSSSCIDPTPVHQMTAIKSLIELEKGWLGEDGLVTLIDFLQTDPTVVDTYTC